MRRSKGEGSVYRRKDGLGVARYEAAGKRKYLYGKTKKIVTDRLRERLSSGVANLVPEADTMMVGEYLDRWLLTVKGTVKERTWDRHEEVVRLHLKPSVGHVKLWKLNALVVQEMYQEKLESGLSPRTVQIVHTTLRKALKQAVRWSLVSGNVGALYVLAVTTGMRQGELLGLKWGDVDLGGGVLRVRRTVWKGVATAPKTAKANRSVRLTGMAKEVLREHLEREEKGEWVFSSRNGTPLNCHNLINRSWWPLLEEVGLPRILFHNLRHTGATLLLSQGVHPKLVQELLGHADISITLNTYSHVIPGLEGKTASAMDEVLA